jgi:hypothetical protein
MSSKGLQMHRTFAIVGFVLEEEYLPSRMQDAAPERPVIDRTAVHEAGKVRADFLPLPVDFVPEEGADRAELGFDRLVVELGGVQARHECRRAELMARKMNGDADHALGPVARKNCDERSANAAQGQCEVPVFQQPDHPQPPSVLHSP